MKTIEEEIDELRRLPTADLVARYEELYGRPPHCRHREHLWKRIAWKLQERRFGGLSAVAKQRLEELISEIDLPLTESQRTVSGALKRPPKPGEPAVGTVLSRDWHGQRIEVRVVDGGFEYAGVVYKTLSAVAKAVTGAHWNGRLFFGLTARRRQ